MWQQLVDSVSMTEKTILVRDQQQPYYAAAYGRHKTMVAHQELVQQKAAYFKSCQERAAGGCKL